MFQAGFNVATAVAGESEVEPCAGELGAPGNDALKNFACLGGLIGVQRCGCCGVQRVDVIAEYDHEVHSPSFAMKLPSVISLREYVSQDRPPAFTRFNVFLRDRFQCQYCGSREELTFDHLTPRCKGGQTTWENVITACSACNLHKADKTVSEVGLTLARLPYAPTVLDLHNNGRAFPPNYLHESWMDYLYWDAELEA